LKGFSAKQEKLLSALLSEKDLRSAAEKAGVSETTAWRWLKEDDFTAEYRRLRRDAVEQAASQLQRSSGEAVETLRKNLSCGNPNAEIAAARIILEQAVKGVEILDLQQRLEQIEDELAKQNKTNGNRFRS
jgi:hypothetical protein